MVLTRSLMLKSAVKVFLLLVVTFQAQANTSTLDKILLNWPTPKAQQTFVEERYDSLLELTSRYQGQFLYLSETAFTIQYTQPIQGEIRVNQADLMIQMPSQNLRLNLKQMPEVAQYLIPIQALMSGKLATLAEDYVMTLKPNDLQHWTIQIKPKTQQFWSASQFDLQGVLQNEQTVLTHIFFVFPNGDTRSFELKNQP